MSSIYDYPWVLVEEALCDGRTGEPILSPCHGAKIMRPYPIAMTGICMSSEHRDGPIKLTPALEARVQAQK